MKRKQFLNIVINSALLLGLFGLLSCSSPEMDRAVALPDANPVERSISTAVPAYTAWAPYTAYTVGKVVSYNKKLYTCRQPHTSLPGWEPANVPALWLESGIISGPPATPSGLRATAGGATVIDVVWNSVPEATGYDLEVDGVIVPAAVSPYSHTGLLKNSRHTYRVRAFNAEGASPWSVEVICTTLVSDPPPATPVIKSARATGQTSIVVSWDSAQGASSYVLQVGTKVITDAKSPCTVTGLVKNTTYSCAVKSVNSAGESPFSTAVSVTTWSGSTIPLPSRIINGYWHNFNNGSGFVQLRDVSRAFDIVNISFAEPISGGNMGFVPDPAYVTVAQFKEDVKLLQSRGQKVIISIGGAKGQVKLNTAGDARDFISSMTAIIKEYGFDGMDIDFEGHSLSLNLGDTDFRNPTTPLIVNTIDAIKGVCNNFGDNFILTMAPETFFVQLGYSFYGGISPGADRRAGAYLPVIHAMRDKLTFLQVQNYNSGPIRGLDDQYHHMGTADFHVAMVDMLLTGFPITKDQTKFFPPLRPDQVLIGLPANVNAGGGFTSVAEVHKALDALIKNKPIGSYTLRTPGGYPELRGLMTWSVNWDAFNNFEFSTKHRAYLDALK